MSGTAVTVGTFDGVHRGHAAILAQLRLRADALRGPAAVVTFEPHPLEVLQPGVAPPRLTDADERVEALADAGVDVVHQIAFDRELAAMSPEQFVERVLLERCGMRALVVGHDHAFGHGRRGDATVLRELAARHGFSVDVVAPVSGPAGTVVSSTAVRQAVGAGNFDAARELLGRWYAVNGVVRTGDRRGRTLGFPTANLAITPGKLLPPDGVYAVVVETPAGRFGGMMNQGHRPTFDDGRRLLEAHLLDFEGSLYDRRIRIEWRELLRPIRRFTGAESLRQQLDDDRERARAALAGVRLDLDAP